MSDSGDDNDREVIDVDTAPPRLVAASGSPTVAEATQVILIDPEAKDSEHIAEGIEIESIEVMAERVSVVLAKDDPMYSSGHYWVKFFRRGTCSNRNMTTKLRARKNQSPEAFAAMLNGDDSACSAFAHRYWHCAWAALSTVHACGARIRVRGEGDSGICYGRRQKDDDRQHSKAGEAVHGSLPQAWSSHFQRRCRQREQRPRNRRPRSCRQRRR
jgi:hypothetical protein